MRAIAGSKRCDARDGGWAVAPNADVAAPSRHPQTLRQDQVIESCTEQPWSEFCSTLERPAFLLPVAAGSAL